MKARVSDACCNVIGSRFVVEGWMTGGWVDVEAAGLADVQ